MFDFTRREWLLRSLSLAGAAFAAQLPPGFSTPAPPPCDPSPKPTPARQEAAGQAGAPGAQLTLEGWVIGIRCGTIAGALVTVWNGSARASATTDAAGRYRVSLVLPRVSGTRVNLRVDVPKSAKTPKTSLSTVLSLPSEGAAGASDPLLSMKVTKRTPQAITASFDVILDL
jgi:protocatechuate 3,4-dioxygenase beta subunit